MNGGSKEDQYQERSEFSFFDQLKTKQRSPCGNGLTVPGNGKERKKQGGIKNKGKNQIGKTIGVFY